VCVMTKSIIPVVEDVSSGLDSRVTAFIEPLIAIHKGHYDTNGHSGVATTSALQPSRSTVPTQPWHYIQCPPSACLPLVPVSAQ
jgi:hypothetical protein